MTFFDRFISGESLQLSKTLRSEMLGRFVHLSDGVTHYEVQGPIDGPVIIFIHGFSVPYFIWDPTFHTLAEAGFRVICYDLLGRGYSDRPNTAYSSRLFRSQLSDLLEHLNVPKKLNFLSLSMGAVVAADFASRNPERINKMSFIDPAGFKIDLSWQLRALMLPLVGEIILGLLGRFGARSLLESMLSDFYKPTQEALDKFIPPYLDQMQYYGFKRALLSTLRNRLLEEDIELYSRLKEQKFPILLIWGEHDQTVPFSHHAHFQELLPRTIFHPIAESGHIPHFEKPNIVNPLLIDFFRS